MRAYIRSVQSSPAKLLLLYNTLPQASVLMLAVRGLASLPNEQWQSDRKVCESVWHVTSVTIQAEGPVCRAWSWAWKPWQRGVPVW